MQGTYKAVYKDPNTLQHHGVKGMRWGVRRYQNADGTLTPEGLRKYGTSYNARITDKQYKHERSALLKKTYESDPRLKQASKLETDALKLYRKYDFEGDDGGGGTTKASQAAGKKYMQLYSDAEYLRKEARSDAASKATDNMIKKYGTKKANSVKRHGHEKAALVALSVLGGLSYLAIKG